MKFLFGNIALVCIIMSSAITPSLACRCFGIQTLSEGIQASDMIFSGEVLSVEYWNLADTSRIFINQDLKSQIDGQFEVHLKIVKLKLERTYKGWIHTDTITITTMMDEAACAYNFKIGERYIVYAWIFDKKKLTEFFINNDANLILCSTGLCTRTGRWQSEEHENLIGAMKE